MPPCCWRASWMSNLGFYIADAFLGTIVKPLENWAWTWNRQREAIRIRSIPQGGRLYGEL